MGLKNTLTDLNNILFEALERINDEDLTGDNLAEEMKRGDQIAKISSVIVKNADTQLRAVKLFNEYGLETQSEKVPEMLDVK